MKRTIPKFSLLRLPRLWTFWKSRTSSLKTPILMTSSSLFLQLIKARALPEMTKLLTVALNKNKGPYVFKSHASLILKLLIFPMQKDFILYLPRTLMTSSSKWKKNKLMKFTNFNMIPLQSHLHQTDQHSWLTSWLNCKKLALSERQKFRTLRRS